MFGQFLTQINKSVTPALALSPLLSPCSTSAASARDEYDDDSDGDGWRDDRSATLHTAGIPTWRTEVGALQNGGRAVNELSVISGFDCVFVKPFL